MPAGGTWKFQNKQRPGAYINFVSVPKAVGVLGDRGVMTCALSGMSWGPTDRLITLYGEDLLNGDSLVKVGCTAYDTAASLPYRLALAGCHKALIFRANYGGVKASIAIGTNQLTAVAKYTGTTGNKLGVVILENTPVTGQYTVQILFDGLLKESFVVETVAEFSSLTSEWIDFSVNVSATDIPVTAGVTLIDGTNGAVGEASYTTYMTLIDGVEKWQCMAIQSVDSSLPAIIEAKIKLLRDSRGKKVQAVVYNDVSADYEGIISVKQGFKTSVDTVSVDLFPIYVASITAGAAVNESNTARVVPSALEITNPVDEEDISDNLALGWFLLSYRQDGAVVVEQDINCLHTFTVDKGYAFSKNRVIRCLDEIGNTVALIFTRNYCGKVDNNNFGRNLFKTEIISLIDQLVTVGAVQNFEGASEITVLPGTNVDAVVVDITIQPVDSMEKLYMTVNVDA